MAFISLFLAFLVIALLILGFLFFAGLILLIIGIIRKRDPKNKGKVSPVVCIILGILFLLPPIGSGVLIGGALIKDYVISHRDYEIVTDEWRAHTVSYEKAARDVTGQLLDAAQSGDRELIGKLFAKRARESRRYESELDRFLKALPKGEAKVSSEYVAKGVDYENRYKDTYENRYYNESLKVEIDGEEYFVNVYLCNRNDDPDEVGLIFFCLQNEKGYKQRIDFSGRNIACIIK